MKNWLKEHWVALMIVAALVVAPIYGHADAVSQASSQTKAAATRLYQNCLTASPRTAASVAFTKAAADARRMTGDEEVADQYEALARLQTSTILAPRGYEGSSQLVEVSFDRVDGELTAHLSERSRELLREGCRQAYLP